MICPQTKAECQYNCDYLMQRQCSFTPPPPTLAEIERLVDAYGAASDLCLDRCMFDEQKAVFDEQAKAKAALMAAIRLYVQE